MCCYFFANGDRPEHAESDVFAFPKQFTVILAIVLQKVCHEPTLTVTIVTYIHKSSRTQK